MKLSKFNIWIKDYPSAGNYLLFNTRTQALIKVTEEFKNALGNFGMKGLNPALSSGRQSLSADVLDSLRENGILVQDEADEDAKLQDFFRQLQHERGSIALEATILTTFGCNFKCVYCFEESVKEQVSMDQPTSDQVIQWLKRHIERYDIKRVFLVYYGGEPFLNIRPMYDISWHLSAWAQERGIEFGFGIVTNGSLMSGYLVDRLLPVGLQFVRVTVDGLREAHDKKRPFIDGRPSFDHIMHNIREIIDKVKVGIAGNFDRENVDSIPLFLDYLEAEGLLHKLDKIDFAPLTPRLGPKLHPGAIELGNCFSHFGKNGMFGKLIGIKKELMRRGVKMQTGLAVNACALLMQHAGLTIDPRGVIYKCNALVGYPEFSVGTIYEDELNERDAMFKNSSPWKQCDADCPYVPLCQGGCRFFSYLENHNFSDIVCKKDFFDGITPDLIKLEYDKLKTA